MIRGFMGGLLIAYICRVLFGVDELIIAFVQQTFEFSMTVEQYFVGFGSVGLFEELIRRR